MDTLEKNNGTDNNEIFMGISLADGEKVVADTEQLYLDEIYNTEEDEIEIERVRKRTMTPVDRRIISVLWILNAVVFAFIGLYLNFTDSTDEYASIIEDARFDADAEFFESSQVFADKLSVNYEETEYPNGILPGFQALYSANNDTAAWIRIRDTNIDHVIVQAEDNVAYERTNFFGDYYVGGTIFMDYRNVVNRHRDSLSKNTIIYGHYLQVHRGMFTDLDKYMDVEYYREHPVIEMSTLYNNYSWKIIGAFLAAAEAENDNALFYYWYDDFSDEKTLGFANEVAFRSYFVNPSIDVEPTDKFLTLSTCSHLMDTGGKVNARFVVVARLVRDGESDEVNVDAAYENTERRMPQLWYDLNNLENPYKLYQIWDPFT